MQEHTMNITLSVDERVAEQAAGAALAMGKSLDQAVRDYLEELAGNQQLAAEVRAFELSALSTPGRLSG
jgi:antitoxin component of RelBE/YafQ-DinJ toxin-antitoxin module